MSKNIVLFVQSLDKPFATTAEAAEGICDISSPVPSVERAIDAQQYQSVKYVLKMRDLCNF